MISSLRIWSVPGLALNKGAVVILELAPIDPQEPLFLLRRADWELKDPDLTVGLRSLEPSS